MAAGQISGSEHLFRQYETASYKSPSSASTANLDAEVIIIGNGPAGLSLSAFLSGWLPFYTAEGGAHPNKFINQKLTEHGEESLLYQDLSWLDKNISMLYTGARPISMLYDTLVRPDADSGTPGSSRLCWLYDNSHAVSHLIVAKTPIGGSWNDHDDDMISVSVGSYLDLPVYSVADWLGGGKHKSRLPIPYYRKYLSDYAKIMHIQENIICGVNVTRVEKCNANSREQGFWEVHGTRNAKSVLLRCKKVVLACGENQKRLLGDITLLAILFRGRRITSRIAITVLGDMQQVFSDEKVNGELEEARIVYNVRDLKRIFMSYSIARYSKQKVVIVGDGISAADSVLYCLNAGIHVLHVVRRSDKQLRHIQLARLNASLYPEYARVFKLLTGRCEDHYYTKVTCATVDCIIKGVIYIKTPLRILIEHFEVLCVCIGKQSDLNMLVDKYTFQDYYCNEDPSLIRIGSLAGDHFVRYLVGGAMDAARSLMKPSLQYI